MAKILLSLATLLAGLALASTSSAQKIATVAGGSQSFNSGTVPALDARFTGPTGMALAPDGTYYIADTPSGVVHRYGFGAVWRVAGGGSGPVGGSA